MTRLNTQFFPPIENPVITVTVAWPGASATDVERNLLALLQPNLRVLDELESINGTAQTARALITLEFKAGTDTSSALSRVEQAISKIDSLPATSDPPEIAHVPYYEPIAALLIAGPIPETRLRSIAKEVRTDLLNAGVGRVVTTGLRDEEIWIRVREEDQMRLGLTIEDISRRISMDTLDLPSGVVEGKAERRVRLFSGRTSPDSIAEIEIRTRNTGQKVLLEDVADIVPAFDKEAQVGYARGHPAIRLSVQRARNADTLESLSALETYVASLRQTVPAGVEITITDVHGKFIKQTFRTLSINALQGFLLVIVTLFAFLNWRIAIWVAAGIPIALLAAMAILFVTGQSLNVISILALIMMLGVTVDDAIIVAEKADELKDRGMRAEDAATLAAGQMFSPVFVASLTTMAAFLPIFFVTGQLGMILVAIPLVVCAILISSMFECFIILPGHLGIGLKTEKKSSCAPPGPNRILARFRDGTYEHLLRLSFKWRYTTIAIACSSLLLSLALLGSGRVGFSFFASPEAENISAAVEFIPGTPRESQRVIMTAVEQAIFDAEKQLLKPRKVEDPQKIKSDPKLVETTFVVLGKAANNEGRALAEVAVQLTPNEDREIRTAAIVNAWRNALPVAASIENVTIQRRRSGPRGKDIDVRLKNAKLGELKQAAEILKEALADLPGVSAISDNLPRGEPELVLRLTPLGTALGFTSQSVGDQVRHAFDGNIAARLLRDGEEVGVRVLRAHPTGGLRALRDLYLLTSNGDRVPINSVVRIQEQPSFSSIRHIGGVRTIAVTAEIDSSRTSVASVLDHLSDNVLPILKHEHDVDYDLAGRVEEQASAFKDLRLAALLAAALIFLILAWSFESYGTPLLIMAIIPFSAIGSIFGHWIMGYSITIISVVGFLGLAGIVLNDSIVLLTEVARRKEQTVNREEAIIAACKQRLRAVLLTTATTSAGLAPLLFETSRNAQFLVPMAITLVFGLIGSSLLILILLPAFSGLAQDIKRHGGALKNRRLSRSSHHAAGQNSFSIPAPNENKS